MLAATHASYYDLPALSAAALTLLFGRLLLPAIRRFLREHGLADANYSGEIIPTSAGVLLVVMTFMFGLLLRAWQSGSVLVEPVARQCADAWLLAVIVVGAAGFADDAIGDKQIKGIAGHWRKWRSGGAPTTGLVKAAAALGGALLALPVFLPSAETDPVRLAALTLLVLLFTNALNLLDTRPGRAGKSYLAGLAVLLLCGLFADLGGQPEVRLISLLTLPVAAGLLLLLPGDLRGRHMLGDAGANVLGFTLGLGYACAAPWPVQAAALAALAWFHALTWRRSFSAVIARNRLLRWLDEAGRRGA